MTTSKQDADFIDSIIPNRLLEAAIEWIGNNMSPEDVFKKESLEDWSGNNSSLNDEISDLKSTVSSLESRVEELREEIYSLQSQI